MRKLRIICLPRNIRKRASDRMLQHKEDHTWEQGRLQEFQEDNMMELVLGIITGIVILLIGTAAGIIIAGAVILNEEDDHVE